MKRQGLLYSVPIRISLFCIEYYVIYVYLYILLSSLRDAWMLIGDCLSLTAKHHLEKVYVMDNQIIFTSALRLLALRGWRTQSVRRR